MTGAVWAGIAGLLFGVFQSVNRATLVEIDVLPSTFIQLLVCAVFMVGAVLVQGAEEVRSLTVPAVSNFTLAGLIHFLGGWTLLNMSQKRLGAQRTSPLLATTPLFGTVLAAVTLDEIPGVVPVTGIALIVIGVYVTRLDRARVATVPATAGPGPIGGASARVPLRAALFGLGAAFSWAVSPIFIREGLEDVDDPVLGVTIGVLAATIAFGIVLLVRRGGSSLMSSSRNALAWKVVAGLLVAVATWTRWYALSLETVAVVLGLSLLTVPTVIVLAPVISGRHLEPITAPVLVGSAFVVVGALVLIAWG